MKALIILSITFAFYSITYGSAVYMNSGRVQLAIEAIHGTSNTGVGAKNNSCLLCHASSAGGPANLNASFGTEFSAAAVNLGFANRGGGGLPATGPNSLQTIFSSAFANLDSDGDGDSNATEFAANTDPADDVSEASGGGGGDSGGCGMIAPPNGKSNFPPASMLLVLLPLAVLLSKRKGLHT